MMKIAINCRSFLTATTTGIGRYARNLVASLASIDDRNRYFLYCPRRPFDRRRRFPLSPRENFSVRTDIWGLGPDILCPFADIYHAPSPEVLRTRARKVVVTVHDLIYLTFPAAHTEETIRLTEAAMKSLEDRADRFICCSRSTRDDLERFFPKVRGRTRVVYNGVDHRAFYPLPPSEFSIGRMRLKAKGIEGPFILFVGTIEPRKNLSNLLVAFDAMKSSRRYSGKLVVCGMKGWKAEDLREKLKSLNLYSEVVFPGYLRDDELRYLYALADAFVYPSFYEGFGYPVLEAMACGGAVVTSATSSLGEIAGEAALIVNPGSPEEICQAVLKAVSDRAFRAGMVERGIARAREFSFHRNAQETLAVYREAGGGL
jgi:glycosyltransferase involved in cell wall biosynthesis